MPHKTNTTDRTRQRDLAIIHMTGKALFGDVSKAGTGRDAYEDWLLARTGKRSSAALSATARQAFVKAIRAEGLVPDRDVGGTGRTRGGHDRPTTGQWRKIAGLARDMGWNGGLEDKRLHGFVERTAKVSSARFLTREQASAVILGLTAWIGGRE